MPQQVEEIDWFEQAAAPSTPQRETRQRPQSPRRESSRLEIVADAIDKTGMFGPVWSVANKLGIADEAAAFASGAADTVTLGFLDEAAAGIQYLTGRAPSYSESLRRNREAVKVIEEESPGAFMVGQLAGGLVPVLGQVGRGVSLGSIARGGAAYGGVYGIGAADEDTLEGRVGGGVEGALYGAAGGLFIGGVLMPLAVAGGRRLGVLFKHGKPNKLAPEVPFDTPSIRPTSASGELADDAARLAQAADGPAEGALLSLRELLGDPDAARAALRKRLGAMSAEQAQGVFARLSKAEADGTLVDDPHFRSLLGIDLGDESVTPETVFTAIELLEEASEEIAKKAGLGKVSFASQDAQFREQLKRGVTMGDLEDALQKAQKGFIDGRMATHAQLLAGVQLVRARTDLLPKVLAGETGAREQLADVITKSAHMLTLANGIKSAFGRNLGSLANRPSKLMAEDIADDVMSLDSIEAIRKRVDDSLKELGDKELGDLLARLRTLDDAAEVVDVLVDAQAAKQFSTYRKAMNSVTTFLRSNALTPATALFNTISFIGHDFFRHVAASRWASHRLRQAGKLPEAMALDLERKIVNGVYWNAHRRGLSALLSRAKWEFWGDVESVARVGWGTGKVSDVAAGQRAAMLADGYSPPKLREDKTGPRLTSAEVEGGGGFGNIVYHLEKAKAVTLNTIDAAGTASVRMFTGAIDDWGREFVRVKQTLAESARFAIREGIDAGMIGDDLLEYAKHRAKELAELPNSNILDRVEAALLKGEDLDDEMQFLVARERAVEKEADAILFMDGPQTVAGRASATAARGLDRVAGLGQVEGVLLPYINTPIRIFERGLVSYTPWGGKADEIRRVLQAGGPEAELAKARMEIGGMMIGAGMVLGLSGGLVVTNGSWNGSASLEAGPPNRVQLPDGSYMEIGRLDPFALTLTIGGFLGQALRAGFKDGTEYDAAQGFHTALQIGMLAIQDGLLEKSYLSGVKDFVDVAFQRDGGRVVDGLNRLAVGALTRAIPVSGTSRQINDTISGQSPEVIGWMDNMLRAIPGAGLYLAPRRDPLGDAVEARTMGVAIGNENTNNGAPISDVKRQLRALDIDITNLKKADPSGFDLTSEELSELRRLRAKEAVNDDGETMEMALANLFADPWFQSLPSKDQKQDAVVEVMGQFNEPARELMESRDLTYLSNRTAYKSLQDYIEAGADRSQARDMVRQEIEATGLPEADRL
ncbi:hypothetical protein [Sphingomonas sp.]|uniref:hypothetical protein n=1 Tax=Sphingomonas sp. TaxID=28214 RepID=UPI002ED7DEEE